MFKFWEIKYLFKAIIFLFKFYILFIFLFNFLKRSWKS